MKNTIIFIVVLLLLVAVLFSRIISQNKQISPAGQVSPQPTASSSVKPAPSISDPLSISAMKQKFYPGSNINVEQVLSSSTNYNRYVVSYISEGLKIYGLLTVPKGKKPNGGWPVILLNHGYIPPSQYSTINSYAIIVGPLASRGYIVFKPDYRGNDSSQGTPKQPYSSPDYVTDSMNALSSIKKYPDANPQKIGVLGHSMGGNITLHELVMTNDFKAAVLWAGVVGSESGILDWWSKRYADKSIVGNDLDTYYLVEQMVKDHGTPNSDPTYWNSIDSTQFTSDIQAPVYIQVGTADKEVPVQFSVNLNQQLKQGGKTVQFKEYSGADHNLSPDTGQALQDTLSFFDVYLK